MSRNERQYTSAPAAAAEAQAAAEEVAPAVEAEAAAAAAAEVLHSNSDKSVVFSNGAFLFQKTLDNRFLLW